MGAKAQGEHPASVNVVFKQKIWFLGVPIETTLTCKHHGHLGLGSLGGDLILKSNGPWFVPLGVQLSLEICSGKAEGCLQECDEKLWSALW